MDGKEERCSWRERLFRLEIRPFLLLHVFFYSSLAALASVVLELLVPILETLFKGA